MNSELTALRTAAQVKKYFKGLGHAMVYGDTIIASNHIWNNQSGTYDHFAAVFDILACGGDDAHTSVMLAAESDEAFSDQGHAFAWAIGMVTARD
ncbi:nucleotidyltransferase [Propionimicrobium lymphophilum]|uniref:Nmad4 family putative nucleotide modification protein n=1 Tax=Propionimicrobium lymphophilum TaxID=33012 RepID=UPI0023F368BE|nr:nucleotidyltransferase [Propionimicrobium lymphophilum]